MSDVDLVTFVLTRISEDERAARTADDDFRSGRRQYNGDGGLDDHFAR